MMTVSHLDVVGSRTPHMKRVLLGAAVFVACLLVTFMVKAGLTLKVTPIPIVITGGGTSTMVELRNDGAELVRLQASTFDWSQTTSGADTLTPSSELLVFPSMLALKPGEARKVRVGTRGGYGAQEKSFRVIFAEIPSNVSAPGEGQVVKVVTQVSVPIFVRPKGAVPVLKVVGFESTKDRVRFQIQNSGGAYARVDKINVKFLGPGGNTIATTDVTGWYVLPGRSRPFEVELGKGVSCTGAASIVLTASCLDAGTVSATLPQPVCAN